MQLPFDATVELTATVVVLAVLLTRLYFAPVVFSPRYTILWNATRRIAVPLLQTLIYRRLPFNIEIENEAVREEYVGVTELTPKELALRLDRERDVEIPLLAGLKTDWDGNTEDGTFVWYCGSKPAGLPRWLRAYQVHVTVFRIGGKTRITAHYEANPWRVDRLIDHLRKGQSFSAGRGIQRFKRAAADANVQLSETSVGVN
jgi:hypothetical protein